MTWNGPINGTAAAALRWRPRTRELYYGDELIKKLGHVAPMQELILDAFEEEGWPPRIDDPLPRDPAIPQKQHLRDTIRNLNRNLRVIRFRSEAGSQGVRWEVVPELSGPRDLAPGAAQAPPAD